jgi:6-phosphogluconolactonase
MIESRLYKTEMEVAVAITKHLIARMEASNHAFYLAVSGGTTPNLLYSLWGYEYATTIPWQRLHLFWVDERCVPPTDSESNYGNMKQRCLDKVILPTENLHRILGEAPPMLEAERYTHEVSHLVPLINEVPQFDMILAGMGNDGHTSSIFPGQTALLTDNSSFVVSKHPETQQTRIAMTGPTMMNAKELIFHVIGKEKQLLIQAMLHPHTTTEMLPAVYIANHAIRTLLFADGI